MLTKYFIHCIECNINKVSTYMPGANKSTLICHVGQHFMCSQIAMWIHLIFGRKLL